jgi:hypothetical protein
MFLTYRNASPTQLKPRVFCEARVAGGDVRHRTDIVLGDVGNRTNVVVGDFEIERALFFVMI